MRGRAGVETGAQSRLLILPLRGSAPTQVGVGSSMFTMFVAMGS